MVFSLEQSVPERIRSQFQSLFVKTLSVVTILYISFGAGGYLSFGPRTKDIITLNLPHAKNGSVLDFAIIVKFCLCISLFVSYPVMLFPVTTVIKKWTGDSGATYRIKYVSMFVRLILVCLTGCIVLMVPNFSDLMAIVGATWYLMNFILNLKSKIIIKLLSFLFEMKSKLM
jgi:proton-coupled amino acid transporter